MKHIKFGTWAAIYCFSLLSTVCHGQIHITEFLYDTHSSEPAWEWIELRNAGPVDVDLNGYFLDDRSTAAGRTSANILNSVGDQTVNTIVPAGQTAVIYNGSALDFDESRFRTAWGLSDAVPLIGVAGWQALNNGADGDAFGLWDSVERYQLDLSNVDDDDDLEVSGFANAVTWLDYGVEGFPRSSTGSSLQWNGNGNFQSSENWAASNAGTARSSLATTLDNLAINDANDIGNPHIFFGEVKGFESLAITEIMYNPASDEPAWEWVELFNGSESTIDFSASPHFFDDKTGSDLSAANVATGSILSGETAILFSDSLSVENMIAAWGDGNYIPVDAWPALNNGDDLVAIWADVDEYTAAGEGEADRVGDGAVFSVTYFDNREDWPNTGQGNSISIRDLSASPDDGLNWKLNTSDDGDSMFANAVVASQPDHEGGDLGTPGAFGEVVSLGLDLDNNGTVDADDAALVCSVVGDGDVGEFLLARGGLLGDFDFNETVAFADFLNLSSNFGKTDDVHYGSGDSDCRNGVAFADFLTLSSNFGKTTGTTVSSVPEPGVNATLSLVWFFLFADCRRHLRLRK